MASAVGARIRPCMTAPVSQSIARIAAAHAESNTKGSSSAYQSRGVVAASTAAKLNPANQRVPRDIGGS